MFEKLNNVLANSYSPYSKFPVAAIVTTKDGREFAGVNVEDASTRAGVCAERCAIFSAIASGVKKGEFKSIDVMVSSGKIGMPCFVCRQMFVELFDENTNIRCWSTLGEYKDFTLKELCPYPFNEDDLKKEA